MASRLCPISDTGCGYAGVFDIRIFVDLAKAFDKIIRQLVYGSVTQGQLMLLDTFALSVSPTKLSHG